jgi:hypothetical protein
MAHQMLTATNNNDSPAPVRVSKKDYVEALTASSCAPPASGDAPALSEKAGLSDPLPRPAPPPQFHCNLDAGRAGSESKIGGPGSHAPVDGGC